MKNNLTSSTGSADGLNSFKSPYSPKETVDRIEGIVKQRGLNVFARIDHAAGASEVGMSLRPTLLLIFGSAQGGTPFMECAQSDCDIGRTLQDLFLYGMGEQLAEIRRRCQ